VRTSGSFERRYQRKRAVTDRVNVCVPTECLERSQSAQVQNLRLVDDSVSWFSAAGVYDGCATEICMWITMDEAITMFARYCRSRFGDAAIEQAKAKAKLLQKRGDAEGHRVWNQVAVEIEKQRQRPSIH
jgi:hypothetical protein